MKMRVFTVYDCKAEGYLQPFFLQTRGQAIRMFTDIVNDPNHEFFKHAEDYTLFYLGTYDDSNAGFEMQPTPEAMGVAIEFKTQREPEGELRLVDMKGRV